MSITFRERSRVERSVLDLVNSSGIARRQLCGLSQPALEIWAANMKKDRADNSSFNLVKITKLLREISIRISSNSDASKHVFSGEVFMQNGTLEHSIAELRRSLHS
jgi:hypothetical protein